MRDVHVLYLGGILWRGWQNVLQASKLIVPVACTDAGCIPRSVNEACVSVPVAIDGLPAVVLHGASGLRECLRRQVSTGLPTVLDLVLDRPSVTLVRNLLLAKIAAGAAIVRVDC